MKTPAQREPSLEDVLAFNDALIAYAATDLPLELEPGDTNEELRRALPQINARLALHASRGGSVTAALESDAAVTPRYLAALESWLHGQHAIEALDALAASAQGRRDMEATARYSLVQPLIVLALVYAAFIFLLLGVAPVLDGIYRQIREAPGAGLSLLLAGRRTLPIWGPGVPVLILMLALLWSWRRSPEDWKWLPGRAKYLDALHKASYADSVARLLENDHSLGQALASLGPLPSESAKGQSYAAANNQLIEAEAHDRRIAWDDPAVAALPALLRWAFTGDLLGQPQSEVLRTAARNYRAVARRYSAKARWWLPTLIGAILGGVCVLAFGVSLFWPMIELLRTLTRP